VGGIREGKGCADLTLLRSWRTLSIGTERSNSIVIATGG